MFGFGDRKKYNGVVDVKLNNEYQICTDNSSNQNFGGPMFYLGLIDNAWNQKMTEDEGALYIATLYYCGILKKGLNDEAEALHSRIQSIASFGLEKGIVTPRWWDRFSSAIDKSRKEFGVE